MSVPFALCADDYGISPGVSAGIRELLAKGRLSGTSCLVLSPHFTAEAAKLRAATFDADIGLHLCFTDFAPLGAVPGLAPTGRLPPLGRFFALALRGLLDAAEIEGEIDRQLAAFARAFGRPPDYVDGHHHVQQLRGVREAVLRRLPRGCALRVCDEPVAAILSRRVAVARALAISALGRGLRRLADARGVPTNRRFAGVRGFAERVPYGALFRRFAAGAPAGLVVMCHPGYGDAALRALDRVVEERDGELGYLGGDEFPRDLESLGLRLARFTALAAPRTSCAPS